MRILILALLVIGGLLLSGCVTIVTTVHPNGGLSKRLRVEVESRHFEGVWTDLKQNLLNQEPGWKTERLYRPDSVIILCTQISPDANQLENAQLEIERQGWTSRRYRYTEVLPIGDIVGGRAKEAARAIPVTFSVIMPGKILAEETNTAAVRGNTAVWSFDMGSDEVRIRAVSVQSTWLLAALTVVLGLLVIWALVLKVREVIVGRREAEEREFYP